MKACKRMNVNYFKPDLIMRRFVWLLSLALSCMASCTNKEEGHLRQKMKM